MNLQARLSKLEATASQDKHRIWRRVIGDSKEECEAKRRALIGAGEALETDGFFFRILVSPKAATRET
jgi:predicted transcriptional regulator